MTGEEVIKTLTTERDANAEHGQELFEQLVKERLYSQNLREALRGAADYIAGSPMQEFVSDVDRAMAASLLKTANGSPK